MANHNVPKDELIKALSSDASVGLSDERAKQLLSEHGENALREKKKKGFFGRFLDQFRDVMIIILIIAAAVSFVVICVEKNWGEIFEPILILAIVILNAVLGVL